MSNTSNGHKKSTQFHEELKQFPPSLRKLAIYIANADEFKSIAQFSKDCGLRVRTVYSTIEHNKKKGKDFDALLTEAYRTKLARYRPVAYKNLIRGIQKGSHKHLELYFRSVGDLRTESKNETNTTINNLCFVLPMRASIEQPAIPENNGANVTPVEQEDHNVIDIEPGGCNACVTRW